MTNDGASGAGGQGGKSPESKASLVRGKYILCKARDDQEMVVVRDGAVLQIDGRIEAVGDYDDLARRYPRLPTLGSPRHAVIPGLVNTHHHVGLTPVQLGTPDLPLELWLTAQLQAHRPNGYLDTLYSAFELIGSGVTAVQHLDTMRPAPVSAWPERSHAVIRAYADIGMRVSYALCVRDQNRLVYASDEAFIATLPPELARETEAWLKRTHFRHDEVETDFLAPMLDAYRGRNLVRIWLAPINLERCSDALLERVRDWAARNKIGIHLHLSETHYQKLYAERRFGTTAVRHLHDIGFLGPHLTVGHAVWVTEPDLELLAAAGVTVCHNASSNLRLRSGIAPVLRILEHGIPVALGIDEAGINDDRDMLQEMRLVKHLHCTPGIFGPTLSAAQIFRMATENGAKAVGFGDEIGTIEPGKRADLVLLDFERIATPHLDPKMPIADAIVYRARSGDVDTVMIDGEVVLEGGRATRVDRKRTLDEIARGFAVPPPPEVLERQRFSQAIFPYVKNFYADWPLPKIDPYYGLNTRR
jgi:cytosine/adenosine deaminase-related metal-dependent hydrolase